MAAFFAVPTTPAAVAAAVAAALPAVFVTESAAWLAVRLTVSAALLAAEVTVSAALLAAEVTVSAALATESVTGEVSGAFAASVCTATSSCSTALRNSVSTDPTRRRISSMPSLMKTLISCSTFPATSLPFVSRRSSAAALRRSVDTA